MKISIEDKQLLKEVRNALNIIIWEKDLDYNDIMYLLNNSIYSLEYIKATILQERNK